MISQSNYLEACPLFLGVPPQVIKQHSPSARVAVKKGPDTFSTLFSKLLTIKEMYPTPLFGYIKI